MQQSELRMQKFAGIDIDQLASLALKIRYGDVRKPLQTGAETAFRPPGAARHTAKLAQIARQKTDDEIPFPERPGLQDEGFAHMSGHRMAFRRNFKVIMAMFRNHAETFI